MRWPLLSSQCWGRDQARGSGSGEMWAGQRIPGTDEGGGLPEQLLFLDECRVRSGALPGGEMLGGGRGPGILGTQASISPGGPWRLPHVSERAR